MSKEKPEKEARMRSLQPKYIVAFAIGSLLYFAVAIPWLSRESSDLISVVLVSVAAWAVMTFVVFYLAPKLQRMEQGQAENGVVKEVLFGKAPKSGSPSESPDGNEKAEGSSAQDAFRLKARIEALKRDQRAMQDRVLRMGAIISIAHVIFAVIMNAAFGLSPKELYTISLFGIAILWFAQIVFLPKWMTYTSLFTFVSMRFAIQTFGPDIIMLLPNFIMLPIFYLLMMVFMFGSIMLPNLMQIKYYKPGDGTWETPKGSMRGQFIARAMVETQIDRFKRYAKGESDRKPTRGMVFSGPPGTGKTLLAKEIATTLELPVIISDASAFNAPFAGFGQLIPLIAFSRMDSMADEYGGCIFFIDEGETLFGARSGMQQPTPFTREVDEWDMLDIYGSRSCQVFDVPHVRTRQWNEQQMAAAAKLAPPVNGKHGIFMMPGAMGGSGAIFPFLTKMSGADSAPMMERFYRRKINDLLNALFFIPVTVRGTKRPLRMAPGKPKYRNLMFITATNRFFMFDPAMIRPGRFGIVVEFVNPDEDERADIAEHYLKMWHRKWDKNKKKFIQYMQDDLIRPERIREFAQATPNTSPAEIEQMIEESVDVRIQHVAELRRVKRYVDEGRLDELLERDRKFWLRFKETVYDQDKNEIPGWDDERVDWHALMETRSVISFGRANPEASNETTRMKVAFHETGHFCVLSACNKSRIKPTLLTVMPRRGSLGMVAHVPHDTREQHPQEYYEGLVRTSVASWVAERFFFGQNLPGVSGDLNNATNIAVLMVGKFGMTNFTCTETEQRYYAEIGKVLISQPEMDMFNPQANALVASVLGNPDKKKAVATILGMAAIDAYRLILKNQNFFREIVPELLKLDEFSGGKLEGLWKRLNEELVTLDKMDGNEQKALPARAFAALNSFYGKTGAEGTEIYEQVVAEMQGVRS